MNRHVAVAILLCLPGCLLFQLRPRAPDRFESVYYSKFRGTIAFTHDDLPYKDLPDKPIEAFETTDLSRPIYLKAFLPEPFGKTRFAKRCPETEIPDVGSYTIARFVTVAVNGAEAIVDVDPMIEPYADQIVEVEAKLYTPHQLAFPFSAEQPPYRFTTELLPRLRPGTNRLVVTAGIRCMGDPSTSAQVTSTLEIRVDDAMLAKARADVGPAVEVARQTNLRNLIPTITTQVAELFTEYTPILVEPLDRGWTIVTNRFDIPVERNFHSVVIAKHEASGRCFGNEAVTVSAFDGTGYTAPIVKLDYQVWRPFPCENVARRTDYTRPSGRL